MVCEYVDLQMLISVLCSKSLEVIDQFTYLGSNISVTECDINIRIEKARTAIDGLSII